MRLGGGLQILHDSTLMVNDLPPILRALPDGGTPCPTRSVLQESVCKKVNIRRELSAEEIAGFPHIRMPGGMATFEFVQGECARIASARGSDLPKIVDHHFLEISARSSELRSVKDGFAAG